MTSRYLAGASVVLLASAGAGLADTTEVRWQDRVVVEKTGPHCADDPNCRVLGSHRRPISFG